ncbi:MAG TPA: hypothetical protein VFY40_10745 [Blastocatellia bacterium]|nr:hypothetical protein [Blastocatellia bacterium]
MNWAHIHLSLNHLPVVGIIFGALLLLLALLRKSEELKRVSLGVFVFTALLALPVYFTGEPAEEVVEHLSGVAEPLIERHENAALFALLMAGGAGVVALAGLILFRRAEKMPGWIVAATLVLSLATSALMGWTANLGGQIRHTEIGPGFTAPAETETEGRQKKEKEEDHE